MDEGRITRTQSYIFIAVSVFTGLPSTFNCGIQRYSGGHYYATLKPHSSQILITILQRGPKNVAFAEKLVNAGNFFFFFWGGEWAML